MQQESSLHILSIAKISGKNNGGSNVNNVNTIVIDDVVCEKFDGLIRYSHLINGY